MDAKSSGRERDEEDEQMQMKTNQDRGREALGLLESYRFLLIARPFRPWPKTPDKAIN
jgi:hypothetical protein